MADGARPAAPVRFAVMAGVLLAAVVLLGGGGSPSPSAEAAVELIALGIFAAATATGFAPLSVIRADPVLWLLIGGVMLFPLLQLLPLPSAWWTALSGRDGAQAALTAAGEGASWRPWSLAPDATLTGALALLPAAVLALLAASMPPRERVRFVALLVGLGMTAALLGLLQFMRGAENVLSPYADVHRGWAIGFFANRNAQADLIAVTLTAGLLLAERHRARLSGPACAGAAVAGALMLASGVATGSRMGIAMLAVPVALAVVQAGRRRRGLALALGAAVAVLLAGGTALDRVTARAGDAEARTEIWGDALFVARSVAPVGGGVGSFVPLYTAAERLDHVQPSIANRAHNDWLELAIEGGLPALALLAALLVLVGRRAAAGWRDRDPDRRLLARFAGLTALILGLHSIVDYPLRTLTLLGVAALALAGLALGFAAPHKRERAGMLTDVHA